MSRTLPAFAVLAALLLSCTGCALFSRKKPALVPPQSIFVGTISLVNEGEHFVLIDNGSAPAPATGMILKSYSDGKPSGELATSDISRHPFVIADIRDGTPNKGDRVFYEPHAGKGSHTPTEPAAPTASGTPKPGAPSSQKGSGNAPKPSNVLPANALPPQLPPPAGVPSVPQ